MPISPRQFPTIVADLRDKVASTLPTLDTSEGTFFRIATIDPFSLELEELENLLLSVQASQSLLLASGVDLDLLAFNYNVQRRGAQKASGFAQFYVPQAGFTTPYSIPKGTIVTSTNGTQYETLLAGVINGFGSQATTRNSVSVFEITLPVSAKVVGVGGNAVSGVLTTLGISGVNSTNDAPIEGGFNQETDTSLATRAIESFGIWSRGVRGAVEYGAKLVPGVYYASAVYAYAGHFKIFVSDQAGNLSDELKTAVDNILTDWAASGIGWTVLAPPLLLQNVSAKVAFKSSANISTQVEKFKQDIATVINASKTSKIYYDDLVVDIKNRVNSYVAHFDLDTPSEHIIQPEGTIIRTGTITVTDQTGLI